MNISSKKTSLFAYKANLIIYKYFGIGAFKLCVCGLIELIVAHEVNVIKGYRHFCSEYVIIALQHTAAIY